MNTRSQINTTIITSKFEGNTTVAFIFTTTIFTTLLGY